MVYVLIPALMVFLAFYPWYRRIRGGKNLGWARGLVAFAAIWFLGGVLGYLIMAQVAALRQMPYSLVAAGIGNAFVALVGVYIMKMSAIRR